MTNLKESNSSCREEVLSNKLQIQSPTYILPIFVPLVIEAYVAPLETPWIVTLVTPFIKLSTAAITLGWELVWLDTTAWSAIKLPALKWEWLKVQTRENYLITVASPDCIKAISLVWLMVFNATFNNISVISWWSVLLVEETRSTRRKPQNCCKSLTNFIT